MKTDKVYCEQIVDYVDKIGRFIKGMNEQDFLASEVVQSGVIMQLALIGELSKKLSENFKVSHKLPWKKIAGFRDKAVHDYFQLDLQYIWATLQTDLGELKLVLNVG